MLFKAFTAVLSAATVAQSLYIPAFNPLISKKLRSPSPSAPINPDKWVNDVIVDGTEDVATMSSKTWTVYTPSTPTPSSSSFLVPEKRDPILTGSSSMFTMPRPSATGHTHHGWNFLPARDVQDFTHHRDPNSMVDDGIDYTGIKVEDIKAFVPAGPAPDEPSAIEGAQIPGNNHHLSSRGKRADERMIKEKLRHLSLMKGKMNHPKGGKLFVPKGPASDEPSVIAGSQIPGNELGPRDVEHHTHHVEPFVPARPAPDEPSAIAGPQIPGNEFGSRDISRRAAHHLGPFFPARPAQIPGNDAESRHEMLVKELQDAWKGSEISELGGIGPDFNQLASWIEEKENDLSPRAVVEAEPGDHWRIVAELGNGKVVKEVVPNRPAPDEPSNLSPRAVEHHTPYVEPETNHNSWNESDFLDLMRGVGPELEVISEPFPDNDDDLFPRAVEHHTHHVESPNDDHDLKTIELKDDGKVISSLNLQKYYDADLYSSPINYNNIPKDYGDPRYPEGTAKFDRLFINGKYTHVQTAANWCGWTIIPGGVEDVIDNGTHVDIINPVDPLWPDHPLRTGSLPDPIPKEYFKNSEIPKDFSENNDSTKGKLSTREDGEVKPKTVLINGEDTGLKIDDNGGCGGILLTGRNATVMHRQFGIDVWLNDLGLGPHYIKLWPDGGS